MSKCLLFNMLMFDLTHKKSYLGIPLFYNIYLLLYWHVFMVKF
nr:MAG TPA: hypothetical protein [Caudoviricetes sp.]